MWPDWTWEMGPNYGAVYGWQDGFLYPLDLPANWHDITFDFGDWNSGFLDFRYVSKIKEPEKIGNPKFWTKIATQDTQHLKVYEAKGWTGSEWLSNPGTSMRTMASTIRILVNATDTNTFIPAPQEAQVSLTLYNLSSLYTTYSYQDIGVILNVTYTYYIEGSLLYGMPIWFSGDSVSVKLAEQGSMLYEPYPSLVFYNQSHTSPVSQEWKIVGQVASKALGFLMGIYLGGGVIGFIGGTATGLGTSLTLDQYFKMAEPQTLNWTQEYVGPPTSRNFKMMMFKTTQDQLPLSPVVKSICSIFVFHVLPTTAQRCGAISIDIDGHLYLPFFYQNPETEYGTWLPVPIEICMMFPVFTKEG